MTARTLAVLAALYFFHFFRHGMVLPLVPLYASEMGASSAFVGVIVSGFNLLSLCLALYVGRVADKVAVRTMLLVAAAGNIVYSLLLLVAQGPWGIFVAQLSGGLGFLFLIVSSQAAVSQIPQQGKRERGFGLLSFAAALGQGTGPVVGGWIVSVAGYTTVFILAVGLALTGLSAIWVRHEKTGTPGQIPQWREAGTLLKDKRFLGVLLFTLSILFAVSLRGSFLPLLLRQKGFSPGLIGAYLSLFAVAMTVVRVWVGRLMGATSRPFLVAIALVLITIPVALMPLVHNQWGVAGALVVFGLGFGISQPLSMVMVSDLSHSENSGLAMGLRFTTITAATFSSPLILGAVAEIAGLSAAFVVPTLLLLTTAVVLWGGWHRLRAQQLK
ncbi:MFS transporter [Desulfohalobium retbaense]|uniref:Major facilitator superfamily MFS_1 n=1 Tax=Desulfohalobium retbaense (strain ATCC 49708 / DSM 5692 / JCM 16813 / HR100) TaxID=485915 RepID=C8X0X0_DESRD|nr:MFS transporter [Desulfohalobium retbaense]ACV68067.1 major facilitator superfamily MFS_1 [Desulfohalobium retbaense DSM 5692]